MTTSNQTINIDIAARDITSKSLASDTFNTRQAITAQMTIWFGTSRGSLYSRIQAQLMDAVSHRISESGWRLNIIAQMEVQS